MRSPPGWWCAGSATSVSRIQHAARHAPTVSGLADGRSARGEGGAVGLMAVVGGLVVAAVAVAVIAAAAGVGVAAARARTAADAAALAAMAASPLVGGVGGQGGTLPIGGGRPEREAARVASANGARVVDVDAAGWPFRVRVTVEAQPRQGLTGLLLPPLRAHATAAARPSAHMR